jgi:ketosteroid isomerase-like protein
MRWLQFDPTLRATNMMPVSKGRNMSNSNTDGSIRAIIEARAKAVHAGDLDRLVTDLADDVMSYDVVDPLRREGKPSSRTRAAEWLAAYDGSVIWENRDVQITSGVDVAFSHSLSRVTGKLKTGTAIDMWFRTTLGFRRIGGRWFITHEHGSVPFNPENGQASLGLKP